MKLLIATFSPFVLVTRAAPSVFTESFTEDVGSQALLHSPLGIKIPQFEHP